MNMKRYEKQCGFFSSEAAEVSQKTACHPCHWWCGPTDDSSVLADHGPGVSPGKGRMIPMIRSEGEAGEDRSSHSGPGFFSTSIAIIFEIFWQVRSRFGCGELGNALKKNRILYSAENVDPPLSISSDLGNSSRSNDCFLLLVSSIHPTNIPIVIYKL